MAAETNDEAERVIAPRAWNVLTTTALGVLGAGEIPLLALLQTDEVMLSMELIELEDESRRRPRREVAGVRVVVPLLPLGEEGEGKAIVDRGGDWARLKNTGGPEEEGEEEEPGGVDANDDSCVCDNDIKIDGAGSGNCCC